MSDKQVLREQLERIGGKQHLNETITPEQLAKQLGDKYKSEYTVKGKEIKLKTAYPYTEALIKYLYSKAKEWGWTKIAAKHNDKETVIRPNPRSVIITIPKFNKPVARPKKQKGK